MGYGLRRTAQIPSVSLCRRRIELLENEYRCIYSSTTLDIHHIYGHTNGEHSHMPRARLFKHVVCVYDYSHFSSTFRCFQSLCSKKKTAISVKFVYVFKSSVFIRYYFLSFILTFWVIDALSIFANTPKKNHQNIDD